MGLSPRLRGNRDYAGVQVSGGRSIPAPAGEPPVELAVPEPLVVYPRACGGTTFPAVIQSPTIGLSPRLRGNHLLHGPKPIPHRSIPAPAGEPDFETHAGDVFEVYPRACGGTAGTSMSVLGFPGLSPRLRGNLKEQANRKVQHRSIPAPAGEPKVNVVVVLVIQVYPRACGGTIYQLDMWWLPVGLSPRLRGNPHHFKDYRSVPRSIPAPAGEPVPFPPCIPPSPVYPRACGGTYRTLRNRPKPVGLSPRLRGNLPHEFLFYLCPGSIPAPAGEPPAEPRLTTRSRVYPRACGGTRSLVSLSRRALGLSPRLRGNHSHESVHDQPVGSIPAPAGEPSSPGGFLSIPQVYPRACGGTADILDYVICDGGLSPRLRGNRSILVSSIAAEGSIPAPAGEPSLTVLTSCYRWVYPRACGGTVISVE